MLLAFLGFASCGKENGSERIPDKEPPAGIDFPEDDGAKLLPADGALALRDLLTEVDPARTLAPGETNITEKQFSEIRQFIDNNLKAGSKIQTYDNIFNWIVKNVRYGSGNETIYLDPYDVFIHKVCVCQGYANLFKIMCQSQDIPAMCVNGWLVGIGGHAWNYAYVDKEWHVSDPTNGIDYKMDDTGKYRDVLQPVRADFNLFEDGKFAYNFEEGRLNVAEVKDSGLDYVLVPFSINGFRITSFCPVKKVNGSYDKLYLGSNVESVGENTVHLGSNVESVGENTVYLGSNFSSLREINVDPANKFLTAYKNVLYNLGSNAPYFIPSAITRLELKPVKVIEKNFIYRLENVEEIVFAEGTERIEAYAVEKCLNLRKVYVPSTVTYMDEDAIYDCGDKVEIVR